jgi:hypothetical protein
LVAQDRQAALLNAYAWSQVIMACGDNNFAASLLMVRAHLAHHPSTPAVPKFFDLKQSWLNII